MSTAIFMSMEAQRTVAAANGNRQDIYSKDV